MSWPTYPERDYQQRQKFGLYLEPLEKTHAWGLRVHGVGTFESRGSDMSHKGRVMSEYALVLVREGSGFLMDKDGAKTPLNAGDILMIVPGWWHLYNPDHEQGWTTSWVIFDGPVVKNLQTAGEISPGIIASSIGDSGLQALGALIDGMVTLAGERADTPQLQARLASELLGLLARISDWKGQQSHVACNRQLIETIEYVENHYPEEIDFDALLHRSKMSSTHFRRQFKKATGDGPQSYQKRLRIRLAKELLRHSNLSVAEIGMQVGYDKGAYFSRVFSKHVGVSPSAWRTSGG